MGFKTMVLSVSCTGVAHVAFIFRTEKWDWVSFPSKKWTGVKLYSHKWIWIEWFTEFNIFHACFQTQEIAVCWIPKTIVKSRKRNFRMGEKPVLSSGQRLYTGVDFQRRNFGPGLFLPRGKVLGCPCYSTGVFFLRK